MLLFYKKVLHMPHFTSKDIAAISVGATFWAILNVLISPVFWQLTHMPFLCDLLAFSSLILVVWMTRKFGAATLTGIIATIITLIIRPVAFHMIGFIVASAVFDLLTKTIGYQNCFNKNYLRGSIILIISSIICGAIAGVIVGIFFMSLKSPSAILIFSSLHGTGGLIGGLIGTTLARSLTMRNVHPIVNENKL